MRRAVAITNLPLPDPEQDKHGVFRRLAMFLQAIGSKCRAIDIVHFVTPATLAARSPAPDCCALRLLGNACSHAPRTAQHGVPAAKRGGARELRCPSARRVPSFSRPRGGERAGGDTGASDRSRLRASLASDDGFVAPARPDSAGLFRP